MCLGVCTQVHAYVCTLVGIPAKYIWPMHKYSYRGLRERIQYRRKRNRMKGRS